MLREKLKQFIEVSGVVSNMAEVSEAANAYMLEQLKGSHSPEQIEEIRELNEKYKLLVQGRLDEFQEKFINLYAEFYTEEDVDALLAFHNSAVAKKQREVSNQLLARAIEISSDFNKELLKQLGGATLNRELN